MADGEGPNQTLEGAHTPPENSGAAAIDQERAAKIGSGKAGVEAAIADFVQGAAAHEAEQLPMMLDEQDEQMALFAGPVAHVASIRTEARGRGRPKGSQNRANAEFRDIYLRMGYRHPALNLADIANANPAQLADDLSRVIRDPDTNEKIVQLCSPEAALAMIQKANAELLPYFESKRPTEIKVDKRVLGVMVIGDMPSAPADDDDVVSLTQHPKPE